MEFEQRRGWVQVPEGLVVPRALGGLWAVRHAQSEANAWFADPATEQRPMRGTDAAVELTAHGRWQAQRLGTWLAGLSAVQRPGLVVCSPYLRTRVTWAVMAEAATTRHRHPNPIRTLVDERLRDREMGVFELHPYRAIRRRAPEEGLRRERVGNWVYRPPGGESLADVALRVRSFLDELDVVAAGEQVLVVTHDAVVMSLRYILDGLGAPVPDSLEPVPNASVSQWRREGTRLALRVWGAVDHLAKDADTG
ncbi:histidine phosphatase family protein [Nocardia fluminea]|uniref:Broad specificity phosphatase PhoE n=1 Tax=Nocardia fluminea TaxID=134984 RepID=A0A2N3VLC0_9NOCA|nr:histidine phosphatase family protein [Nocardia fluminea]PKV82413.1 broad specificity phosphatase PhoE [Nocardia fluminea]